MRFAGALAALALMAAACDSTPVAVVKSPSPSRGSTPVPMVAGPILGAGSMAFDEVAGDMVLVDPAAGVTWTWDGVHDWRERVTPVMPSTQQGKVGGDQFGMAWDAATGSVIAEVGDYVNPLINQQPAPATWSWKSGGWTRLDTAGTPLVAGGAIAAFPPNHQLIMFSGCCAASGRFTAGKPGMWSWDGTEWLALHPAHMPPARWDDLMVFDPALGKTVMYGGAVLEPDHDGLNDIWAWDGTDWSALPAPVLPQGLGTSGTQMAFAPGGKLILMASGATWTFDGSTWAELKAATPVCEFCELAYDPVHQVTVMVTNVLGGPFTANQVWTWNGSVWTERS